MHSAGVHRAKPVQLSGSETDAPMQSEDDRKHLMNVSHHNHELAESHKEEMLSESTPDEAETLRFLLELSCEENRLLQSCCRNSGVSAPLMLQWPELQESIRELPKRVNGPETSAVIRILLLRLMIF